MTGFSQPERQGLERLQMAQAHPDPDLLNAFSEQTLSRREREQMLAHLAVCAACRDVVSLSASAINESPVPGALPKPALWKWPVLRWGAVAASAVIVVVAVSVSRLEHSAPQMAKVASETARLSTPATQKVPAEEVLTSAGVKAPQIRYEKVAPKTPDKDAAKRATLPPESQTKKQDAFAMAPGVSGASASADVGNAAARDQVGTKAEQRAPLASKPTAQANELAESRNAPPPVPATHAKVAVLASSETVEVRANAAIVQQAPNAATPQQPAKETQDAFHGKLQKSQVARTDAFSSHDDLRYNSLNQKWQVSPEGYLLASGDEGKNWSRQFPDSRFTHVQAVGNHVWASGPDGVLVHSVDGGMNWTRVSPMDKSAKLQGEITSIVFSDVDHGTLKTSTGESWLTGDAGQTWKKQ
jgi:hypothetical protein